MPRLWVLLAMLVVAVGVGKADPWWYAYEGMVYPWEEGWGRVERGGGAVLSLEDGALIIDSLASTDICDSYYKFMPSVPGAGTVFRMDWRVCIYAVAGFMDPGVAISFGPAGEVLLGYAMDKIYSMYECQYVAEFVAGVYHEYVVTSSDMLTYGLYIDGVLAHVGELVVCPHGSYAQWGDLGTGAASLSAWDYARFGVVPAPQAGDVNCDGTVDFHDINPFVQALTDGEAYQNMYSGCWPENADINSDGSVDFGDINPFIELLTS